MAAERPRGKAEELVDDLLAHPFTDEDIANMSTPLGSLRLRSGIPTVETDGTMQEVMAEVDRRPDFRHPLGRILALAKPNADPAAVVMPVDTYLRLVHWALHRPPSVGWEQLSDDRSYNLPALEVEELNPPPAPTMGRDTPS
jgi:hypothetical protein